MKNKGETLKSWDIKIIIPANISININTEFLCFRVMRIKIKTVYLTVTFSEDILCSAVHTLVDMLPNVKSKSIYRRVSSSNTPATVNINSYDHPESAISMKPTGVLVKKVKIRAS